MGFLSLSTSYSCDTMGVSFGSKLRLFIQVVRQAGPTSMLINVARGPIRVLVANQLSLVSEILQLVLDTEVGFDLVDHASGCDAVMQAVQTSRPDVVLVDLDQDAPNAVRLVAQLTACASPPPVVLLVDDDRSHILNQALNAGAAGCVSKRARLTDLYRALRAAVHGQVWMTEDLRCMVESA
jgi:DNA-binding NarL/FixJ family response regulator